MKLRFAFATLLLSGAALVQAAPASAVSVDTLLDLTKSQRVLEVVYANIEQNMRQGMQAATVGKTLTAQQQKLLQAAPAKIAQLMREELSWDSLKPVMIGAYTQTFDQEEIDGLIAFYQSPVGQSFADKQPLVAQRMNAAMQERMKDILPKMQAAMRSALQEAGVK